MGSRPLSQKELAATCFWPENRFTYGFVPRSLSPHKHTRTWAEELNKRMNVYSRWQAVKFSDPLTNGVFLNAFFCLFSVGSSRCLTRLVFFFFLSLKLFFYFVFFFFLGKNRGKKNSLLRLQASLVMAFNLLPVSLFFSLSLSL